MNGPRYNFFWLYILDLHNHYVEDHRGQKVNPLSTIMDQILSDMMISAIKGMEIWTCVKVLLCDISSKNKKTKKVLPQIILLSSSKLEIKLRMNYSVDL